LHVARSVTYCYINAKIDADKSTAIVVGDTPITDFFL